MNNNYHICFWYFPFSQPSKLLSINDDFVPPSLLKKKAPPNGNRKQEMTAEETKETDAKKPIEGGIEEETEEQQPDEPLFHIWGVNDFLTDDKRTDGQTQPNSDRKQTNASVATESSDLCGTSFEIISPPSPKTPTEEQPFANPMDRLRKRTELEIKESGSASVTAPPLTSLGFYGFPHRRSVSADGKKIGENKYCRCAKWSARARHGAHERECQGYETRSANGGIERDSERFIERVRRTGARNE